MKASDIKRFERGKEIYERMESIRHALQSYGIVRFRVEYSDDCKCISEWIGDLTSEERKELRDILLSHYWNTIYGECFYEDPCPYHPEDIRKEGE